MKKYLKFKGQFKDLKSNGFTYNQENKSWEKDDIKIYKKQSEISLFYLVNHSVVAFDFLISYFKKVDYSIKDLFPKNENIHTLLKNKEVTHISFYFNKEDNLLTLDKSEMMLEISTYHHLDLEQSEFKFKWTSLLIPVSEINVIHELYKNNMLELSERL